MKVVVSPHLDDAVLSAWLVLRRCPGTRVVSCFAGMPTGGAGTWDAGFASAAEAVAARRREDDAALARAGALPTHLDLLDVQYRGVDAPSPLPDLVAALRRELSGAEEVWLPAGIGGHPDHLLTRDATLSALQPGQSAYLYADLPYAAQPGWAPVVSGSPRDRLLDLLLRGHRDHPASVWSAALGSLSLGSLSLGSLSLGSLSLGEPQVHRLRPAEQRDKLAGLACYASQLAALRCGPGHPLRTRRLLRREVSWPLR